MQTKVRILNREDCCGEKLENFDRLQLKVWKFGILEKSMRLRALRGCS